MFTRIDHVMVCVPHLQQGIEQYTRLGFNVYPGGVHPGRGTHNAIAFHQEDYLELLAVRDRAEHEASARAGGHDAGLLDFIAAGGGLRYIIVQSDDLPADVAAMRARGVDVGEVREGSRRTATGAELRWRYADLGPGDPLPLFFIQHLTPLEERQRQVPRAGQHPNGVLGIERAYVVAHDAAAAAKAYARVLGVPVPPLQRGTVIMADMAVFALGPTGLGVAQPYAPGPAAEALERRGPGPFQVLHRTRSVRLAAEWLASHGVSGVVRGVRNTGEHALLAPPAQAGGVYVGFAGPE